MTNYIKLRDDILALGYPMEEKVVLALIIQMSEKGKGFWAGYKAMSTRLGIPKSSCKRYVEHLEEEGRVTIYSGRINGKTRKILAAKFP